MGQREFKRINCRSDSINKISSRHYLILQSKKKKNRDWLLGMTKREILFSVYLHLDVIRFVHPWQRKRDREQEIEKRIHLRKASRRSYIYIHNRKNKTLSISRTPRQSNQTTATPFLLSVKIKRHKIILYIRALLS